MKLPNNNVILENPFVTILRRCVEVWRPHHLRAHVRPCTTSQCVVRRCAHPPLFCQAAGGIEQTWTKTWKELTFHKKIKYSIYDDIWWYMMIYDDIWWYMACIYILSKGIFEMFFAMFYDFLTGLFFSPETSVTKPRSPPFWGSACSFSGPEENQPWGSRRSPNKLSNHLEILGLNQRRLHVSITSPFQTNRNGGGLYPFTSNPKISTTVVFR